MSDAQGRMIDAETVTLKGTSHQTRTDGSGFFMLAGIKPGSYTIQVPGSKLDDRKVLVEAGKVLQLDDFQTEQ